MLNISVAIGEVVTEVMTDQQLSFEGIESLLSRATTSTLNAYNSYVISSAEYEKMIEDDE
jgi:hypothetical protein